MFVLNTYGSHIKHGLTYFGYFNFGSAQKENAEEATDLPKKTDPLSLISIWTKAILPHSQVEDLNFANPKVSFQVFLFLRATSAAICQLNFQYFLYLYFININTLQYKERSFNFRDIIKMPFCKKQINYSISSTMIITNILY